MDNIFETIPLFPCLPDILSPSCMFLFSKISIVIECILFFLYIFVFRIVPLFMSLDSNELSFVIVLRNKKFIVFSLKVFSFFLRNFATRMHFPFIVIPVFINPFFFRFFKFLKFMFGILHVSFSLN